MRVHIICIVALTLAGCSSLQDKITKFTSSQVAAGPQCKNIFSDDRLDILREKTILFGSAFTTSMLTDNSFATDPEKMAITFWMERMPECNALLMQGLLEWGDANLIHLYEWNHAMELAETTNLYNRKLSWARYNHSQQSRFIAQHNDSQMYVERLYYQELERKQAWSQALQTMGDAMQGYGDAIQQRGANRAAVANTQSERRANRVPYEAPQTTNCMMPPDGRSMQCRTQ